MDHLDSAYIHASGRLYCDQKGRIFINFSGYDGFLLITAGHGSCLGYRTLAGSYIVSSDQFFRIASDGFFLKETEFICKLRLEISLEHHVVLQGIVQYKTMFVAVFRNVALTENGSLSYGSLCQIFPVQMDRSGFQIRQSGKSVDQFTLTVSVDSGNADDLTFSYLERYVAYCIFFMGFACDCHSLNIQNNFARLGRCFFYFKADVSSNHHGRKLLRCSILNINSVDIFSLAENGAAVCYFHDLIQFMSDKKNAFSFGCQTFHDLHQLCDLLNGQNCCRFVKDQDLIVTVQHLQDLSSLLHSYGDILNQSIRIYLEMILL